MYLGSHMVSWQGLSSRDSSILEEIIMRTISGSYYNSNITTINDGAFYGCSNLTSVNLPNVTFVGNYAFGSCLNLTTVNLPKVTWIANSAFTSCINLSTIKLPRVTTIQTGAFISCSNLLSLYLLGNSIPNLDLNAFYYTPFSSDASIEGVYGSIYVPASLYNNYLITSNWSDYSERIVPI